MKRTIFFISALCVAIFFASCPHPHNNDNKSSETPSTPPPSTNIILKVNVNSVDELVENVITSEGLPYTVTHVDLNPLQKLVLKAEAADSSLAGKKITFTILEPTTDAPVILTETAQNTFDLVFKKVDHPVAVKVEFAIEGTAEKRVFAFTVLPEPSIKDIVCEETDLTFGKGLSVQIKSKFTCNPEKIGNIAAESFLLNASKKITYTSSDPAIADVSEEGILTTKATGTCTISLTTPNAIKTEIKVTVENTTSPQTLTLSKTAINLIKGANETITLAVSPSNGDLSLEAWQNTNPNVGSIEKVSGTHYKVTALSKGVTTFKTKAKYNKLITLELQLTVSDKLVDTISISPAPITLEKGKTQQLTATVSPAGAPQQVRWESNKPHIISVDDTGLVTAIENGVAVISAISTSNSEKVGKCIATVAAAASDVTLNKTLLELTYTESFKLSATIEPAGAAQDVTWSVSDGTLLSFSSDGTITAKSKTGKATVTATSNASPSKKAECTVYIASAKVSSLGITPATITMDTNSEKDFTVEINPSGSTRDIDYEIEGANLELTKFAGYYNKYDCTVKAKNLAEIKKIKFWSKANPNIKVELPVTTIVPVVASITLEDITITTEQMDKKMIATILPANAVQTVTWESDNESVVQIDSSGLLTPITKGVANITATSTSDSTKKATAKVTVNTVITDFTIAISPNLVYYGSPNAELTITPNPIDGWGGFEATTTNTDLEISPMAADPNKFTIKVKKNTAQEATATISVKALAKPSLAAKTATLNVRTVVPTSLTINGPAKMYKNEELSFNVSTNYGYPTPLKDVAWSVSSTWYTWYFTISDDGKLKCTSPGELSNGNKIKITATSKLDNAVKAEKEITVYDNIAQITSVSCDKIEYTLDEGSKPRVTINLTTTTSNVYTKFVISEKTYFYYGTPTSDHLEEAVYTSTYYIPQFYLKPNAHTSALSTTFYVFPVDPKTDMPITTDITKTFSLTIWQKATGIELERGNFDIYKMPNGHYDISAQYLIHNQSAGTYWVYAKIIPQYAKPLKLHVAVPDSPDAVSYLTPSLETDGRTKVSFGTQRSALGSTETDNIRFSLFAGSPIFTFLRVTIN